MTRSADNKFVVLDRDGTIVIDRNYLSDPDGLQFLPGAAEGLQAMTQLGWRLIVITNQSGVGRGMFPLERLHQMNSRLEQMFASSGARLERVYFCPHRPEDACDCRKPKQKLMQQAGAEFGFDPADAVVIGDKESDVEFGRQAGATTMLVAGTALATAQIVADYVVRDLRDAANMLQTLE